MACYGRQYVEGLLASKVVEVVGSRSVENYTVYIIEVCLGLHKWTIQHRYSQFNELHEKLQTICSVQLPTLPPKKIFGNQSEAFIRRRQGELQRYLQELLALPSMFPLPEVLATFLGFNTYEIHGLTQLLAEDLFNRGDLILEAEETFHVSPLLLHSICTRLQLPEPTCESGDKKRDIGHILDFITRLKYLKIVGTNNPVGSSNINMNQLTFDLSNFKALQSLGLMGVNCEMISGMENLKSCLTRLCVHHSLSAVKDILLVELGQGQWLGGADEAVLIPAWATLTSADFSYNKISAVDQSIKLMANVQSLDLSHNQLSDIQHLQYLSELTCLDLSHNHIANLNSLHTKLGNITTLCLAGNKLDSLQGFSKLYSLESLDVGGNEISQVLEVRHVSSLPCLEKIVLSGNPVQIVVDYRTRILELFGDRAGEVALDGAMPTQKELDTVAVLLAIQKSRQTKERAKKQAAKKPAVEAPIAEATTSATADSGAPSGSSGLICDATHHPWELDSSLEPTEFRMQVEAIRARGGAGWLALLNQMQSRISVHSQRGSDRDSADHGARRRRQDSFASVDSAVDALSGLQSSSSSSSLGQPLRVVETSGFMLPETLPGKSDSIFTTYVQELLPNTKALTRLSGVGSREDRRHREERPVFVMWCPLVAYTFPYTEVPACVFVTTENLHLFRVQALRGDSGMPNLVHTYCIPLLNIQQIVLGYQQLYLRLEEAFVGPQGTFAFLTSSPHKTSSFMDALRLAIYRAHPEADQDSPGEPHIVVNGETELNLKAVLNRVEGRQHISQVQLVLYLLVHTPDLLSNPAVFSTHTLVITTSHLYVIREDYVMWPQPTFGIGPSTRPQFEIVRHFPVGGRISGISMYDTDTFTHQEGTLQQTFMATNSTAAIAPHFIGFGVRLCFETSQHNEELDIRVPTSGMRDRFLATLTQVRRDLSERSPSPPKLKPRVDDLVIEPTWPDKDSKPKDEIIHPSGSVDHGAEDIIYLGDSDPSETEESEIFHDAASEISVPVAMEQELMGEENPPPMPVIRTHAPPNSLAVIYPSVELLGRLTRCNENMALLKPLSSAMKNLASMTGEELLNLFHSQIAQIGMENEELVHVMWSMVVPFQNPCQEITTCVVISNKALYFVSDESPRVKVMSPQWKTHHRVKSDSVHVMGGPSKGLDPHHTSGILHPGWASSKARMLRSYYTQPLKELRQINVAMFDQAFRILGSGPSQTFTCVTRDTFLTEGCIKQLMMVLSAVTPSPSPDVGSDHEPDFYRMFARAVSCTDSVEFTHPSKVRFIYPSEDSISDLTYLMVQSMGGRKPPPVDVKILLYLLVFQLPTRGQDSEASDSLDYSSLQPRTLVVTTSHACLAIEDYVSYPLPEFTKSPPENPNFEILQTRNLELLRRVVVSDFTSHDLSLVFADEVEDIVVDTSREHYAALGANRPVTPTPEVTWTLVIQNQRDRDRLLKLLCRQWSEIHDGEELSVQVSA